MFNVGIVEVAITVLFLIPRTAFVGAILITAYLGGATCSTSDKWRCIRIPQ